MVMGMDSETLIVTNMYLLYPGIVVEILNTYCYLFYAYGCWPLIPLEPLSVRSVQSKRG